MRVAARSVVAAAVLVVAAVGLAAPASAATCTFDAATHVATVDLPSGDSAVISRSGDAITVDAVPCAGATVTTTDTVVVNSTGTPVELGIDLGGGAFEPGATVEDDEDPEIEFTVNLPTGLLRITGSAGQDHLVSGANGINLNAAETTGDVDVTIIGAPQFAIQGAAGDDIVSIGGGSGTGGPGPAASLLGQDGDDHLLGGEGGSVLDGGAGTDEADYSGATQLTLANLASGSVEHQAGGLDSLLAIEDLTGSPGDDGIRGDAADNTLRGGGGDDAIAGGAGNDTIDGGAGSDTVDLSDASKVEVDLASGSATGEGSDDLEGIENVLGSPGDDEITGDGAANVLAGAAGDDTIGGGAGDDTLVGGEGKDTVSFASSRKAVTVDLKRGRARGDGADTLAGFEHVEGSNKADEIRGNGQANTLGGGGGGDRISGGNGADDLVGNDGNDLLFGERGTDVLEGGDGRDQLNGGNGRDRCVGGPDPDSFVLCETIKP
jgi:Ca2+-binding RTX toxin-like protein